MRRSILSCFFFVLVLSPCAPAATRSDDLLRRLRACQAAYRAGMDLLKQKQFDRAAARFREADRIIPNRPHILYNLACALSLGGKTEEALWALERAVRFGFIDHQHMSKDPDLTALRKTEKFQGLLDLARKKAKGKPPLLHVPKGYDPKGRRVYPLLVTLHGAGGRPEGLFRFARRALGPDQYFVLGPYGSAPAGSGSTWSTRDVETVAAEVRRLKKKYRIGKVYLFGFSAGAHIGYVFVLKHRDLFDGFIPMAGAIGNSIRRRWLTEADLKKAKGLRIYAIQGKADRVVSLPAAKQTLELLDKHGAVTRMHLHPGGHTAPPRFAEVLRGALQWLEQARPTEDKK